MRLSITRRQVAVALIGSAASAQAPQPARESAEQLLHQARDAIRRNRDVMSKVNLPMAVEPASVFRA